MSKERTYQYNIKNGELVSVEEISENPKVSSLPVDSSSNSIRDENEPEGE